MTTRLSKEFKRLQQYNILPGSTSVTRLQDHWHFISHPRYGQDIVFTKINLREYLLGVKIIFTENRINQLLKTEYLGIPSVLQDIIISYLPKSEEITLTFGLNYPEKYPFIAPTWKLLSTHSNSGFTTNIKKYYTYLVDMRNKQYASKGKWTSAITMEKDIFDFMVHINHFNYLVNIENYP